MRERESVCVCVYFETTHPKLLSVANSFEWKRIRDGRERGPLPKIGLDDGRYRLALRLYFSGSCALDVSSRRASREEVERDEAAEAADETRLVEGSSTSLCIATASAAQFNSGEPDEPASGAEAVVYFGLDHLLDVAVREAEHAFRILQRGPPANCAALS